MSSDDARGRVVGYVAAANIPTAGIIVTVTPGPQKSGHGKPVTVEIELPFASVSWPPTTKFLKDYRLTVQGAILIARSFQRSTH